MATDWTQPTEDSLYLGATGVIQTLKDRDFDAGSLFLTTPSAGLTAGMIRYLRASNKFQEYDGAAWVDKVISLAGGGTGGATAADARTSLGLGTIATQNANNVNITGGNLAGSGSGITNLNADSLASGTLPGARFPAVLPAASGVNLTLLNASNLGSGTVPDARFPATLPALNGSLLTNLNASAIATGTVAPARLGSGSGGATKFLREDNTWQDVSVVKSVTQIFVTAGTVPADSTLDITVAPALADYTKATVIPKAAWIYRRSDGSIFRLTARLVGNSTLRVHNPGGDDITFTDGTSSSFGPFACDIVEYKNVG